MKIKKLILFIPLIILSLLLLLILGSVYYPKPFLAKPNYYNINYELKQFSLTNPEYVSYQYDSGYDRYDVFFTKMTRGKYGLWEINNDQIVKTQVLKDNIDSFKSNLQSNKSKSPEEILKVQPEVFVDKYIINSTDTFEQREYKRAWHPPIRDNSTHFNLDKFKLLATGEKWPVIEQKIGKGDFGLTPDEFYPDYYRIIYNIGSKKISFAFLTFKDGYPDLNEETYKFPLADIVLITQTQEMIKVPVNPDGTYNWGSIKDRIE
jgi:hypothetical protein